MPPFRAEDYLAAVKVLEEHGYPLHPIEEFTALADRARKRDSYFEDLGKIYQPRDSFHVNGANIYWKLIEDGWTAPEGLL